MPATSATDLDAPASTLPPMQGNPERLNKVADMIQSHPEHFDMGSWIGGPSADATLAATAHARAVADVDITACKTTGCIAGWAVSLWPSEISDAAADDIVRAGADILGLSYNEAHRLFFMKSDLNTADKAADHLRRMALAAEAHQFDA